MRKTPKRNLLRPGLTLAELLLALAISAMLLAVAMRVMTTASRCSAVGENGYKNLSSRAQLERLLRMDLQAAEQFMLTKEGDLCFKLRSKLDPKNLALKHQPSTVTYRIVQEEDQSWLLREQDDSQSVFREFVAPDVEKIVPAGIDSNFQYDSWQEMTDIFTIEMAFTSQTEPVITVSGVFK